MHANIPPPLARLAAPIDTVTPHPDNARNGDVEAVAASLAAHGQYAPIVAQDSTGRIIKGNHVYAAAMSLGWDTIAVTRLDVDDDQALRILLVDNRTSDLGQYDDAGLADLLAGLDDLEGTGYDDRYLTRLLARLEADATRDLSTDTGGLGDNAVVAYTLVFDTLDQQNRWYAFLKWLRGAVDGETIAGRLDRFIAEVLATRDGDAA